MIYTSYFAKLKRLPDNIVPVSICAKPPAYYRGIQYKKLAPRYSFFSAWKETHDNEYYTACFKDQVLDHLTAAIVIDEINKLLKNHGLVGRDIALICYEKPQDFCHRHLVADWLNENGIPCEEYQFAEPNTEDPWGFEF